MKKIKGFMIVGVVALLVGITSLTVFAESKYNSPAEIVAGITGRTKESVVEERKTTNKTYGTIASDAGALDEFKTKVLEMKKSNIDLKVATGEISQAEANEIIENIENNQLVCDGTGNKHLEKNKKARFGNGERRQENGHRTNSDFGGNFRGHGKQQRKHKNMQTQEGF